jgi:hypothetical protein
MLLFVVILDILFQNSVFTLESILFPSHFTPILGILFMSGGYMICASIITRLARFLFRFKPDVSLDPFESLLELCAQIAYFLD